MLIVFCFYHKAESQNAGGSQMDDSQLGERKIFSQNEDRNKGDY